MSPKSKVQNPKPNAGERGRIWALAVGLWSLATVASAIEAPNLSRPGQLPLYFEANCGQSDAAFQFIARGRHCNFFVAPTEAVLTLTKLSDECRVTSDEQRPSPLVTRHSSFVTSQTRSLRFEFLGANP